MATTDSSFFVPGDPSLPSQPVDAAGGATADYGKEILDLFKFGIGAATSLKAQEITAANTNIPVQTVNGKTSLAGQASSNIANGITVAGMSLTTMLMIGGGLLVALLVLKKVM